MEARHVRIVSTGESMPATKITSEQMDARLGVPAGSSFRSTGVQTRYFADPDTEPTSRMGARAARAAIETSGLAWSDISAIVCTSGVQQQAIPYTASLIQKEIGPEASGIPCFDLNTTCLSFVAGLDVFSYLMEAGRYERILFVSTENSSIGLDPEDLHTHALFGDGACAVVFERTPTGESSRILSSGIETYSEGNDLTRLRAGGNTIHPRRFGEPGLEKAFVFQMSGKASIKLALQKLPPFVERLLKSAQLKMSDIDLVIPHQASRAGMEILRQKLGVDENQWMDNLEAYGNMISASIPLALRHAILKGRIKRGDKIFLLGTSAGFSVGGAILIY